MDLLDCKTEIHLGATNHLGTVGVQCTGSSLYVYLYKRMELVEKLTKVDWEDVVEIRLNPHTGEIKFTLSQEILLVPGNEPLKVWFENAQVLFEQINQQFASCIVKVKKWKPNLTGHQYYKPASKTIRKHIPETGPITEEDFREHMEIAIISQEVPIRIPKVRKSNVFQQVATILDNIL